MTNKPDIEVGMTTTEIKIGDTVRPRPMKVIDKFGTAYKCELENMKHIFFADELEPIPTPSPDVVEALKALILKLDAVNTATIGVFQMAVIHGMAYNGPNYAVELANAKAALAALTEAGWGKLPTT